MRLRVVVHEDCTDPRKQRQIDLRRGFSRISVAEPFDLWQDELNPSLNERV